MKTEMSVGQEEKSLLHFIDYYEVCNRAEDKSPKTVSWYSANLKSFYNYLKNRHLPDTLNKIDIKVLRQYVLYLLKKNKYQGHPITLEKQEPLSASSVHGHVRTLRVFFKWLVAEGLIENNPARDLKPPKICQKVVSTLSDEEIRAILGVLALVNSSNARNQTIFMLLIDTGLRMGELINLKMDDVHMNEGLLKVMGKGRKERIVPMGSNAQRAPKRYLFRYRPKPYHPGIDNVFLSVMGKPLTENGLKLIFSRLARRSGVTRLHAHLCRHTFATRFLINGGDVFTLQQILGHSTLEMVRNYVNLASNHVAIQHQKFSPLDRLNLRKA
ncbi:tyrosine-type recombinase/integrase [Chloroflexota bacterium]